ncbi:MAG: DegT/DnrJ/EryC1/StrS family aminotransferase [Rhodocyclaceae bacterium]|nr:DegT/DnrJ/EryC1/StrS family aminotransferase [Rhodocyclaceae bacterium]
MLDTLIFDPSACGFPKPRVPLLPTGLAGLSFQTPAPWAPAGHFRHFARGRYALREAYRLAGVGPGGTLLAPAYHCRTMLDPALALGGDVVLYPLRADLSPDRAALDALADHSPTPVKALLATHFFGIPQALEQLAAWCAERGITLVEDCSHALFSEHCCPPGMGRCGEFVVSSPYKFLPSPDGGLLYAREAGRLNKLRTHPPTWTAELRGLAYTWSKAAEHRRSRTACDARYIDAELAAIVEHLTPAARDFCEPAGCSADYRPDEDECAALRLSRTICRHPDSAAIARRRRENYLRWMQATANLQHCRPLFPELPAACIPYMFPLLLEHPEPHFHRLKHLGVPIWRWDSLVASACQTANNYRLHLLHLPCHQSLSDGELDWMIAAVLKVGAGETAEGLDRRYYTNRIEV